MMSNKANAIFASISRHTQNKFTEHAFQKRSHRTSIEHFDKLQPISEDLADEQQEWGNK